AVLDPNAPSASSISPAVGVVKTFVCPSRRAAKKNYCDYAGFLPMFQQVYTWSSTGYSSSLKFYRSVLGCDENGNDDPVRIADIIDGTAATAVLTDKWMNPTDYKGGATPADVDWNLAGTPNMPLDPNGQWDGNPNPNVFVGSNTKRIGFYGFISDRQG